MSNSAINFVIVAVIALMPPESTGTLNLAALYIIVLFFDASFLTINEISQEENIKVGAATVFTAGLLGAVSYSVISGAFPNWPVIAICLLAAWSKAQQNATVAIMNYRRHVRNVATAQGAVLLATLLTLGISFATNNTWFFAVTVFALAPLASLIITGSAPQKLIVLKDFKLLPEVVTDFFKNQVVFFIFGKMIEPVKLADILFARSLLSPLALGLSVRRKELEDGFLIRKSGQAYLGVRTVTSYVVLLLLGLAGMAMTLPLLQYAGIWIIVVVLQDLRAHLLRVNLIRQQLSGHLFAGISLATVFVCAAISLWVKEFVPWMLLGPFLIEMVIFVAILAISRVRRP